MTNDTFTSWDDLSRRNEPYGAGVLATLTDGQSVLLDSLRVGTDNVQIFAKRVDLPTIEGKPETLRIDIDIEAFAKDEPLPVGRWSFSVGTEAFCANGPFDMVERGGPGFVHQRMIEEVAASNKGLLPADLLLAAGHGGGGDARLWF